MYVKLKETDFIITFFIIHNVESVESVTDQKSIDFAKNTKTFSKLKVFR